MAKKYYHTFYSNTGTEWTINIYDRNYASAAVEWPRMLAPGFNISWENEGDEAYFPIKPSSCEVYMLCDDSSDVAAVQALFTGEERTIYITIERDGDLFWLGQLIGDLPEMEWTAFPLAITIQATDGIGILSDILFSSSEWDGGFAAGKHTRIEYLIEILTKAHYNRVPVATAASNGFLKVRCSLRETQMPATLKTLPYIRNHTQAFFDEDNNADSYYNVLTHILRDIGCRIYFSGGYWYIDNIREYTDNTTLAYTIYDYDGVEISSGTEDTLDTLAGSEWDAEPVLITETAYKRVEVTVQADSNLMNGTSGTDGVSAWTATNTSYIQPYGNGGVYADWQGIKAPIPGGADKQCKFEATVTIDPSLQGKVKYIHIFIRAIDYATPANTRNLTNRNTAGTYGNSYTALSNQLEWKNSTSLYDHIRLPISNNGVVHVEFITPDLPFPQNQFIMEVMVSSAPKLQKTGTCDPGIDPFTVWSIDTQGIAVNDVIQDVGNTIFSGGTLITAVNNRTSLTPGRQVDTFANPAGATTNDTFYIYSPSTRLVSGDESNITFEAALYFIPSDVTDIDPEGYIYSMSSNKTYTNVFKPEPLVLTDDISGNEYRQTEVYNGSAWAPSKLWNIQAVVGSETARPLAQKLGEHILKLYAIPRERFSGSLIPSDVCFSRLYDYYSKVWFPVGVTLDPMYNRLSGQWRELTVDGSLAVTYPSADPMQNGAKINNSQTNINFKDIMRWLGDIQIGQAGQDLAIQQAFNNAAEAFSRAEQVPILTVQETGTTPNGVGLLDDINILTNDGIIYKSDGSVWNATSLKTVNGTAQTFSGSKTFNAQTQLTGTSAGSSATHTHHTIGGTATIYTGVGNQVIGTLLSPTLEGDGSSSSQKLVGLKVNPTYANLGSGAILVPIQAIASHATRGVYIHIANTGGGSYGLVLTDADLATQRAYIVRGNGGSSTLEITNTGTGGIWITPDGSTNSVIRIYSGGVLFGSTSTSANAHAEFGASTTTKAQIRLTAGTELTTYNRGDIWRVTDHFRAADSASIKGVIPVMTAIVDSAATRNGVATDFGKYIHLSNSAARTYNLPAISAVPAGVPVVIADGNGNAATNNITINRAGSDTFRGGATSLTINTNYGLYEIWHDGTNWYYR